MDMWGVRYLAATIINGYPGLKSRVKPSDLFELDGDSVNVTEDDAISVAEFDQMLKAYGYR